MFVFSLVRMTPDRFKVWSGAFMVLTSKVLMLARARASSSIWNCPSMKGSFSPPATRSMPHFGQVPGRSSRTSGCMEHV